MPAHPVCMCLGGGRWGGGEGGGGVVLALAGVSELYVYEDLSKFLCDCMYPYFRSSAGT